MRNLISVYVVVMAMTVISCEALNENGIVSKNPEGISLRSPNWNEINQEFGLESFHFLVEELPSENIIISPMSIELALSMTSNGASGETLTGMMEALAQDRLTRSQVNTHFLELINDYNSRDQVALNLANSIWMKENFPFKDAFLETSRTFYQATARELDFDLPSAKDTINGWVNDKTQGRIPEIIDRIDPDAVMFLINAIYFKGQWLTQFDRTVTSAGPFYFSDGRVEDREFMFQMEPFPFIESEDFLAVSIPFKDSTLGMSFFLPNESVGVNDFVREMTIERWKEWNEELAYTPRDLNSPRPSTEVLLWLPKFEIAYEKELNDLLIDRGMDHAFSRSQANFGDMTDAQVFISEVKHKTFMKIDEAGAEAAAITSVGVGVTSGPPSVLEMKFNRPFMVVLHDYERGNILFIGKIEDPTQ